MTRDVRQLALDYLAEHHVVTLATNGPAGLWAAAVFYASRDFELLFLSAAHTRHARNIDAAPAVAGTIQADYRDWPSIKGIQLSGSVSRLTGAAEAAAIEHYKQRYPFIAEADAPMQQALRKVGWYCLVPTTLYLIDNSLGLGHRDPVILPAGR